MAKMIEKIIPVAGMSSKSEGLINSLLVCGMLSTALYTGADIAATMLYDGYSYTSQAISELSAIGAPSEPSPGVTVFIYHWLVIAFGSGLLLKEGKRRSLRNVALLLIAYGLVGLLWPITAMQQQGTLEMSGGTKKDTVHLILGAVDMMLYLLIILTGAMLFGKRFRFYSIAALLVLFVSGTMMSTAVSRVASNSSTPWPGVTERTAVFSPMIWILVLSVSLLRAEKKSETDFTGVITPVRL